MTNKSKVRLLATTVIAGALIASPALAQTGNQNPNAGQPSTDPGAGATPQAPVIGGSSVAATPDNGNRTDANGNANPANTEVVVTGSRIANPNLTSNSPLTVVNAQELKLQGTTRVEDLLNSLPQVFAEQGGGVSNAASGTATVNLRNLGSVRTLVLINGRRLVPGDPIQYAPDLNFIPEALIQRVEVLTGGASSIYGSDAVAGVVNFIMNKDFTGVRLDAQYSLFNHDNEAGPSITNAFTARGFPYPRGISADGAQKTVSLIFGTGTSDERGHITAYATYRNIDAVTQDARDYSSCGLNDGTELGGTPGTFACAGSSTSVPGRFRRETNVALGAIPVYAPTGPSLTLNPAAPGTFRPFVSARDAFNFNPYNYFQRPDTRYTAGAFAHYEISKAFDPYAEVMFMDDRTLAQIAPSGAFYGTDFFVNCNNPYLSGSQATALCGANAGTANLQPFYLGRRNVEGGSRIDDLRHTDYRIVVGTRGEIADGVTYDAYGQLGRSIFTERYSNDFSRSRLNNALNAVVGPNGNIVCASAIPNAQGAVTDANCVPYNPFTVGGVTQAATNYLQTPGFQEGETSEYVASGSVTASLGKYGLKSPFSDEGIGVSVGAEYRRESVRLNHDVEFLTGDLAGQGTPFGVPDVSGSFHVAEEFGEIRVPIASGRPFFDTLAVNGSFRHSDYSTVGGVNAYKIEGEFAPVKDIRFRGGYSRAVRAPNVNELFTPASVQLFNGNDPCTGATPSATLAQCARTGVTAAEYGTIDASPAAQYNQRTAGTSTLRAETADTYTAGVVLAPRYLRNFNLSVDGFDITVNNEISTIGAQTLLNGCLNSGNAFFCNGISRAAGSGSLFTGASYVDNPNLNIGKLRTRGIDVAASYRFDLDRFGLAALGSLGFDFDGTYLDKLVVTPITGANSLGSYDCAGFFGSTCGTPSPKWRHKLRLTLNAPGNFQISGQWRYFGPTTVDYNLPNPNFGGGVANGEPVDPIDSRIRAVSYFDLTFSIRVQNKFSFRVGSKNIFDKDPPIVSSTLAGAPYGNGNTFPVVYDALGRYIFAGVTLDF